jgi:ribonuclease D
MQTIPPSKAETSLLPPFAGLTLAQIVVVRSAAESAAAAAEILAAGVAGFDTESRPTFVAGAQSKGPHVLQFALPEKAFIFQLQQLENPQPLAQLLQDEKLLKIGFELKSDRQHIQQKLGISLAGALDLNNAFRQMGYGSSTGARAAVGLVLQQNFRKSKHVSTSNWSLPQLTERQLLYAANDAFAALKVYQALQRAGQQMQAGQPAHTPHQPA